MKQFMSTLKIVLIIYSSVYVGGFLMLLEHFPMNIWIARFIGEIAAKISDGLLAYYFHKEDLKLDFWNE